jgi:hypothetical protein
MVLRGALLALLAALGCVGGRGGWDVRALERANPGLDLPRGHRLGDLAPYFWIDDEELLLFACRWRNEALVEVRARDASPEETALLGRAVAALDAAVPGLALRLGDGGHPAQIEVTFADLPPGRASDPGATASGDTVADCRVEEDFASGLRGGRLHAGLVSASVRVLRGRFDALGRPVPQEELDLFAALLHELGHALGFGSHASRGILQLAPSEVRLYVRPVFDGAALEAPTLAALYRLPSGTVLGRGPLDAQSRATARVFADLAARSGWGVPLARAGQRSAEVFWPVPGSGSRRVLRASRGQGRWPEAFALRANDAAREALRSSVEQTPSEAPAQR